MVITSIDSKDRSVLLSYREYENQKSREEISSYLFKGNDEESYKPFESLLKRDE